MLFYVTECKISMERGQNPTTLTEQAWSIKDLLRSFRRNFSCGTQRVVPSGQNGAILPSRVAITSAGSGLSCPLTQWIINILNWSFPQWRFSGTVGKKMKKIIQMNISRLKIPTCRGQIGWLFSSTIDSSLVVRATGRLEPVTSEFHVRRANHSATDTCGFLNTKTI